MKTVLKNKKRKTKNFIHGESFFDRVMMNDDENISVAIRKKNRSIEEIVEKRESVFKRHPSLDIFIIRGIVKFFEGSVNQLYVEKKTKENTKKTNSTLSAYLFFIIIILLGMTMYFIVPTIISFYLKDNINDYLILNGLEGFLRLSIFLTLFSIIVTFERNSGTAYHHGAEHKVLWCFKKGEDLTLENVKKYSTLYPACGTGLIFYMVIFSFPLFLFLGYENIFLRILLILIGLPFLIGFSFEVSLWLEEGNTKISKFFSAPILFLQRFNTKEPDEEHLEIALIAIKNLIKYRNEIN